MNSLGEFLLVKKFIGDKRRIVEETIFLSYFAEVEWEHQTIAFCSHKKSLVYLKYSKSLPRL